MPGTANCYSRLALVDTLHEAPYNTYESPVFYV
jgi:hypothetical protein